TSEGTVVVALDMKNTPNTVNNFVTLSRYKYYDTSYIFRTDVSLDIIQGGGATNSDSPGYTIKDEGTGFAYKAGDLVMARSWCRFRWRTVLLRDRSEGFGTRQPRHLRHFRPDHKGSRCRPGDSGPECRRR
ncbi:MAG: hypothetical protein RJA15_843, partial [Actinomycetota bacterium]